LVQETNPDDASETTEKSLRLESGETFTLIRNRQLAEVLIEVSYHPENWEDDQGPAAAEKMLRLSASDRFGEGFAYALTPEDSIAVTGPAPGDSPELLAPFLEDLLAAVRAPLTSAPEEATNSNEEPGSWTRI
jgi:hypothetical protein